MISNHTLRGRKGSLAVFTLVKSIVIKCLSLSGPGNLKESVLAFQIFQTLECPQGTAPEPASGLTHIVQLSPSHVCDYRCDYVRDYVCEYVCDCVCDYVCDWVCDYVCDCVCDYVCDCGHVARCCHQVTPCVNHDHPKGHL